MNRLLSAGISFVIAIVPLYAEGQAPDAAKLKADAQNLANIISGDKAKTQVYCQINEISEEQDQAEQAKDNAKTAELSQKSNDLGKQLGPEYLAFVEATKDMDFNSKDGQEIVSIFGELDSSCRRG